MNSNKSNFENDRQICTRISYDDFLTLKVELLNRDMTLRQWLESKIRAITQKKTIKV